MKKFAAHLQFIAVFIISLLAKDGISQPDITSYQPTSGWPGELISIQGNNFNEVTSASIGGEVALIVNKGPSSLTIMVPNSATTGPLNLNYLGGSVSTADPITILSYDPFAEPSRLIVDVTAPAQKIAMSADGSTMATSIPNSGTVKLFSRVGNIVTLETTLTRPSLFGQSIALSASGQTLAVGAIGANSKRGLVYVFEKVGGVWTEQWSYVPAAVPASPFAGNFGSAVALSADGNTMVVGAPYDAQFIGGAYVFSRTGNVWTQVGGRLQGTGWLGLNPINQGSTTVVLSDDGMRVAVFGSDDGAKGAVWIFQNQGGAWIQVQKLTPPYPNVTNFGSTSSGAMTSDGRFLFVGATSSINPPSNLSSGCTIAYEWNDVEYIFRQRIQPSQALQFVQFGRSLSCNADGSILAIGECDGGALSNGRTRVFLNSDPNTSQWEEQPNPLRVYFTVDTDENGQGKGVALSRDGRWLMTSHPDLDGGYAPGFFLYSASPPPVVSSFDPIVAGENDHVMIYGQNFETIKSVEFNGALASSLLYINPGQVRATVPAGSNGTGAIRLTTKGGQFSLAGFTYVEPPSISMITPTSGGPGTVITITGQNFELTT